MAEHPRTSASPTAAPPVVKRDVRWLLAAWFGLKAPVGQRFYLQSGFGLMLVKYTLDAVVIYLVTGRVWTGLDYLSPLLVTRKGLMTQSSHALLMVWLLLTTLPFIWIGASMSVRRAMDAGLRPRTGLYFFMPFINYLFMLLLCVLPSRGPPPVTRTEEANKVKSALLGVAVSVVISVGMVLFSVFVLHEYAAALFVGTPFLAGASSAFFLNRGGDAGRPRTFGVASLAVAISGGMLLLFALEGVMCLAMAFPLAWMVALVGAALGRMVALQTSAPVLPLTMVLLMLPLLGGAESLRTELPLREVATSVEIDAPPEQVWPHVIGFSELPPPPQWFFRLGIAYPQRARIEGAGVGAVRHCEFSTGPFVEPITRWEPPTRLSFDVTAQPRGMKELSPYNVVHAPHLDNYLQSRQGEFRLVALPGGRTRLEGSTWYEVAIFPQAYWTPWSDGLIHAIHVRVLEHIARLSTQQE